MSAKGAALATGGDVVCTSLLMVMRCGETHFLVSSLELLSGLEDVFQLCVFLHFLKCRAGKRFHGQRFHLKIIE